ncbi:hypothetical protein D3C87_1986270 [compost metagenome]
MFREANRCKDVIASLWHVSLEGCFDSCPGCVGIIFWYDNRYLVADGNMEVRDAGKKNTVFFTICLNVVGAVMLC